MKLIAKPSLYVRTFLGDAEAPCAASDGNNTVKETDEANDESCIALELQDISLAIMEGLEEEHISPVALANSSQTEILDKLQSIGADPNRGIVRYFMNLKDARQLCCHLIHELAKCPTDKVAQKLEQTMFEAIDEERRDAEDE
jgi:hypothetical protein